MIRRIEAIHFRCLRYTNTRVDNFHVLVGPNASGKSTFLDVVGFIGDLLRSGGGISTAVQSRSQNFQDLVWMHQGNRVEMALEIEIPASKRIALEGKFDRARYELAIGNDSAGELSILGEALLLKPPVTDVAPTQREFRELFPHPSLPPETLFFSEKRRAVSRSKWIVSKKSESGNDYFMSETTKWNNFFRLGPRKLALANLPEDEVRFPVATWVKRFLMEGIHSLVLNGEAMRRPSPPTTPKAFQPDGSNLPWVIEELRKSPDRFKRWVAHLRTALPDIHDVQTVEREEDRHRYVKIEYKNGLKAPSWIVSDGTLRILALTSLAYLRLPGKVILVEEPENGIHPRAVETVFQSLSSAYETQILCASHSPVVLSLAQPSQVLCFAKDDEGATDIVNGDEHPLLKNWRKETDLGTLFATGMLG